MPFLILNLFFGLLFFGLFFSQKKDSSINLISRDHLKEYVFTSPILDCEEVSGVGSTAVPYKEANEEIKKIADKYNLSNLSLYFRDLNNGQWIGVNEKEYFSPASMLKIPLVISLFKWAEKDPSILNKEILVESKFFDDNLSQHTNIIEGVKLGEKYTFYEIATKTIQQSDNVATKILYENIPQNFIDDTYTNIGVPFIDSGEDFLIRVKDMASFYRVLFNASYLNRENSEKTLAILSKTSYKDGIVNGVPKDVAVAHKFGERFSSILVTPSMLIPEGDIQLHDCGIVYVPNRPYILCVMTRGKDFKLQQQAIGEVSKLIYEKVTKNN